MTYYLGAYFLLKLRPLDFGKYEGLKVATGSRCLNDSYLDTWSLPWTQDGKNSLSEPQEEFGLTNTQIKAIQKWSDKRFDEQAIGWINTFSEIETLREYKKKFFPKASDFEAIGIFFPENVVQDFIDEFEQAIGTDGKIGILNCLKNKTPEQPDLERFIGYDLIGIEYSGDYHSFHCYDKADELIEMFGLTLNEKGLFEEFENKKDLLEYANDPVNGLPDFPWYIVRVKALKGI